VFWAIEPCWTFRALSWGYQCIILVHTCGQRLAPAWLWARPLANRFLVGFFLKAWIAESSVRISLLCAPTREGSGTVKQRYKPWSVFFICSFMAGPFWEKILPSHFRLLARKSLRRGLEFGGRAILIRKAMPQPGLFLTAAIAGGSAPITGNQALRPCSFAKARCLLMTPARISIAPQPPTRMGRFRWLPLWGKGVAGLRLMWSVLWEGRSPSRKAGAHPFAVASDTALGRAGHEVVWSGEMQRFPLDDADRALAPRRCAGIVFFPSFNSKSHKDSFFRFFVNYVPITLGWTLVLRFSLMQPSTGKRLVDALGNADQYMCPVAALVSLLFL